MDEREQPFMAHLNELRQCLIRALYGVLASMIFCYIFVEHIMLALRKPMLKIMPASSVFVVLSPQEYFFTELKAALFSGLIVASPWIFWQLWRFVAPGLYRNEKKLVVFFVLGASSCFILGLCFAYFLVFPPAFAYFLGMLPKGVQGSYSIGMLYGFSITLLLAFGLIFQTPVAVFLLVVLDLVPAQSFTKHRRIIFVMAFVVGALLTPPDPITQVMLALPAYGLFELGLVLAKIAKKNSQVSNEAPSQSA